MLDDSPDPEVAAYRKAALESVRNDPGLQQLVPYFLQFVAEKVTHCLDNLFVLEQMLELDQALMDNPTLFVDPYITNIVPPIITCLLGRKIGREGVDSIQDQYRLRDLAASLIGNVVEKYSKSSQELQARVTRTCLKYFLDPGRTLGQHYGAIEGIRKGGGAPAILALVLPNLKAYEAVLVKAQNELGPNDENYQMLITGIMTAIASIADASIEMTNGMNGNAAEATEIEDYLGTVIGSHVVALGNHELNLAILESKEKQ